MGENWTELLDALKALFAPGMTLELPHDQDIPDVLAPLLGDIEAAYNRLPTILAPPLTREQLADVLHAQRQATLVDVEHAVGRMADGAQQRPSHEGYGYLGHFQDVLTKIATLRDPEPEKPDPSPVSDLLAEAADNISGGGDYLLVLRHRLRAESKAMQDAWDSFEKARKEAEKEPDLLPLVGDTAGRLLIAAGVLQEIGDILDLPPVMTFAEIPEALRRFLADEGVTQESVDDNVDNPDPPEVNL